MRPTKPPEPKRRTDFIASVEALGDEALAFVVKAADDEDRWLTPNIGLQDVVSRLREYGLALDALMGVAPPEANILLAASRLAISTKRADNTGVDVFTGHTIVLQYRDDIRKALGDFKGAGKPLALRGPAVACTSHTIP